MHNITGHVIFCEDIRKEINNQSSYIGVFSKYIEVFQDREITMPRLSAVVHVLLPSELAGQIPSFRVFKTDNKQENTTLAEEEIDAIPDHPQGKSARLSVQVNFRFEGIPLTPGDQVFVSVQVGEAKKVLGSIRVTKAETTNSAWDPIDIHE